MRQMWFAGIVLLLMALSGCTSEETSVTGIGDANSAPALDPLSGTWTGDWGATPGQRNLVTLGLNWDGKTLGGSVDPGPNAVAITKGSFVPDTGMLAFEATGNAEGGKLIQYVVEGKVIEGSMSGTWTQDGKKGDFKLTRK
jgi:hypothetical protein